VTLETFEVEPKSAPRGSVIWMHGLGATNHDFDDVVPMLKLPDTRFVFPQAPDLPVTINSGMVMPAWYDIVSFADPPLREDPTTVRRAARLVQALIDREVERGIPSERIVLMGFSQGGAMALHVGKRCPTTLAGIGVLSGYLVLPSELAAEQSEANLGTPTLFCHGTYDPVVPHALGRLAYDTLLASSPASTEFHSFPMQHSLCLPEIDLLGSWLRRRLE
jgi:phospholipase/carboxylesterase